MPGIDVPEKRPKEIQSRVEYKCPYCNAPDMKGVEYVEKEWIENDDVGLGIEWIVKCYICNASWLEIYSLTKVIKDE